MQYAPSWTSCAHWSYTKARHAKIDALQLYRTSASALDRAQGTILRNHNIVVAEERGLRNGFERESFGIRDLLAPVNPLVTPR